MQGVWQRTPSRKGGLMLIQRFLKQTVSWQAVASTNDRDDPIYAAGVQIPARSMQYLKDLIGRDGEVTTATNRVMLQQTVSIGDLLDGREVIGLDSLVDYRGVTVGYSAFTR